jgi:hypothetical protein
MYAIQVENLKKSYGTVQAVNVTRFFRAAEFFADGCDVLFHGKM